MTLGIDIVGSLGFVYRMHSHNKMYHLRRENEYIKLKFKNIFWEIHLLATVMAATCTVMHLFDQCLLSRLPQAWLNIGIRFSVRSCVRSFVHPSIFATTIASTLLFSSVSLRPFEIFS